VIKNKHSYLAISTCGLTLLLNGCKYAILDPKGSIAADEKHILIISVLLMLMVVVPVIILTFTFAWRYREKNTKAIYSPSWAHSTPLEIIWWSIPCIIIGVLGTITWVSSHQLDPYRPLSSMKQPITIQVIALEWKWLFIYPDQHIATVNFVQFPVGVPIRFLITAEGPMNSFQIPQLAGQIYAMAGMQTKLNLIANEIGDYAGISANFSGKGFSGMKFIARATSQEQFSLWVKIVKQSPKQLTPIEYNKLAQPSENNIVEYFSSANQYLFETAVMNPMMPIPIKNLEKCTPNQKAKVNSNA